MGPAPEASGIAVVGDVVNTASRLADLAPAGTVLVEERTWRRTRHAIRYGRRGSYLAKRQVGAGRGVPRPERPAPRSRQGERLPSSAPSSWIGTSSSNGSPRSSEPRGRTVGRGSSSSAGRPARGRPGWRRSSPGGIPTRSVIAGRSSATGSRRHSRSLAAAIGELAGISLGGSRPPRAGGGSRRSRSAWRPATMCAAWREGCRCCSSSTSARRATDPRGPGTRSRPLGRCWRASRATSRSSSCSSTLHWADPAIVDALGTFRSHPWSGPLLMVGLTGTESLHRLKAQARVELDAIPDEAMGELASLALGRKAFTPRSARSSRGPEATRCSSRRA